MPDFSRRDLSPEMMDDLSITDWRLTQALDELERVNRWLGGHGNSLRAIAAAAPPQHLRVLDVGAGGGDFLASLTRWSKKRGVALEAVGVDLNEETVAHARRRLDRTVPPDVRSSVRVERGDALALPYEDGAFDVAHASLFLHHFDPEGAVAVLRELRRVAGTVIVNDLHRHPAAYHSIRAIARLLSTSPMFRADAPHSVLRAFTRAELEALARAAGLHPRIVWRWAFRWILTAS